MNKLVIIALGIAGFGLIAADRAAAQQQWATVKGQVVWSNPKIPPIKMLPIAGAGIPGLPAAVPDDSLLIDAKSKGVKNVMVWLAPNANAPPLPVAKLAEAARRLEKMRIEKSAPSIPIAMIFALFGPPPAITITQSSGIYSPRIVMMQSNQILTITNGLPVFDQFEIYGRWGGNGTFRVPLAAGAKNNRKLIAEIRPLLLSSGRFGWMKGRIGVFDHPYFALTDKDGKFEIKLAPVGKFRIYILHEESGWLHKQTGPKLSDGQQLQINPGENDIGIIKM